MQRGVAIKAMAKGIVEVKKWVVFLESVKELLLRTNVKVTQQSRLTRKLLYGAKKSLVGSVPNRVIGIEVKVEDAANKW